MTIRSIATALALGLVAFTLSILPVTTANAECIWMESSCPSGWRTERTVLPTTVFDTKEYYCCRDTPSKPYATGETEAERQAREVKECAAIGGNYDPQKTPRCIKPKPVKNIGKRKGGGPESSEPKENAALKATCQRKGWRYTPEEGCIVPSQVKAACEAKGQPYDVDTGKCVKSIGKRKVEAEEPKKKKKGKRDEEVAGDNHENGEPKKKSTKDRAKELLGDVLDEID